MELNEEEEALGGLGSGTWELGSKHYTPFGEGTIEQVLEASADYPSRLQLALVWGGTMFSADSSGFREIDYDEQNQAVFRQGSESMMGSSSTPPTPSFKRGGGKGNLSSMAMRGKEEVCAHHSATPNTPIHPISLPILNPIHTPNPYP